MASQEGPTVFLSGLTATVLGFGIEGAVKFGTYESLKPLFISWVNSIISMIAYSGDATIDVMSGDTTISYLLASIVAGAIASLMLCPMERARIQMVTDGRQPVCELV